MAKFEGDGVAKLKGDGWLSRREMVDKVEGRWVAKFEEDGWLS